MNIFKKIKQNKITFFLLIILLLVILLKLSTKSQKLPPILETPRPTVFPSPTSTPRIRPILKPSVTPLSQESLEKIITQLPFKSEGFTIEYYERTKKFAVTISAGPIDQTIIKVEDWFKFQGVQDFSQIEILWQPTREVLNEAGVQMPIPAL